MNKKSIRTVEQLVANDLIAANAVQDINKVVENFSLTITEQMHALIDKTNPTDPIRMQFVPSKDELTISANESTDPIGDQTHTKVKGIVHRYPDRCLFTPVHVCPIYCRFCFRREMVGNTAATLTPEEIDAAFAYLEGHQEIWEVILTGGDPLILKPSMLKNIIDRLKAIKHIEVIRIHTRVPVVESARITPALVAALKGQSDHLSESKPVYVILHSNHATEFTLEAKQACAALIDAGIPMLSQTILLKGLNDNIEVLSELMRCFIKNRIKPYYLHHGDLARGTKHFRTTIEQGQQLMRQLRGRFSGMCQPTYVLDIPNGYGKAPIGPDYINKNADCYVVEDYQGMLHEYKDDIA